MALKSTIFAALAGGAALVAGLGQKPIISTTASSRSFQIAGGSVSAGQILVSDKDWWGVIRAAGDLAMDFGRVTGTNYTLSSGKAGAQPALYNYNPIDNRNNSLFATTGNASFTGPKFSDPAPGSTVIIAGTIGKSEIIDGLIAKNLIDVKEVKGKWEAFVSTLVQNPIPGCAMALVIAGSDPRGSIYGIYDVSEQIGVSPWYFWADVPTKKTKNLYVLPERKVQASPSVRYRGIFLNDEQPALTNWVASNFPDNPINNSPGYNAAFYSLVCELLLRLRANYLWPALWATMLHVDDPNNQPILDAYEIVLGSSHTEPLMRAQNEFKKFYPGEWAYNLNNKTIDEYFEYGVKRAKPYARNSLWTMGMRGTGDTAIEGLGVDKIVTMLQTLVGNQQRIISDGLGVKNISEVPQMWCLYKEVMSYLIAGLKVPDDVTLLWADDNWGNNRRLPLANETQRHGGAGIYFHFDYVGDVRNYKWINTIQLSKTAEQMHMAYARGADRIWVVNVGDLKPVEIPISHFLDMAYDAEMWNVDSSLPWSKAFAAREWGTEQSGEIADVMNKFGMYTGRRKMELIEPSTYSVINYGEADAVIDQWERLGAQAQIVHDKLAEELRPAFFQLVLHPILAGTTQHRIHITAAKNAFWSGQKRNLANDAITRVLKYSDDDANLQTRWNNMLGGKWKGMMDQTHLGYDGHWQQPMRNTLPAVTYVQTNFVSLAGHVGVGVEGSNATVQGDDKYHSNSGAQLTTPPIDRYGPPGRYFEVFFRGTNSCSWTATVEKPWLKLSQYSGSVGPNGSDTRVWISVDWSNATTGTTYINVTTPCRAFDRYGFGLPRINVPVNVRTVPTSFTKGFVESDGHIAIEGPHYQAIIPAAKPAPASNSTSASSSKPKNNTLTYHTFAHLGRTVGGVGLWPMGSEKLKLEQAPALEYSVYLFTNSSAGAANVTLYLSPSQNYLGEVDVLEYGISLFPANSTSPTPKMVKPVGPFKGGDMPPGWGQAVADGVWGRLSTYTTTGFNVSAAGEYKLRIWALLPSIIVQKIVIDVGGVRASYLGPPESFLVGRDVVGQTNRTTFANGFATLGGLRSGNATKVV